MPRPVAPPPGQSMIVLPEAGDPSEAMTCPDTATSLVAIKPNEMPVFSCDTASVTRAASPILGTPG